MRRNAGAPPLEGAVCPPLARDGYTTETETMEGSRTSRACAAKRRGRGVTNAGVTPQRATRGGGGMGERGQVGPRACGGAAHPRGCCLARLGAGARTFFPPAEGGTPPRGSDAAATAARALLSTRPWRRGADQPGPSSASPSHGCSCVVPLPCRAARAECDALGAAATCRRDAWSRRRGRERLHVLRAHAEVKQPVLAAKARAPARYQDLF